MTTATVVDALQVLGICAVVLIFIALAAIAKYNKKRKEIMEEDVRRAAKTHNNTGKAICLICAHVRPQWRLFWPPYAVLWCGYRRHGDYSPLTGKKNELRDAANCNTNGECKHFCKDWNMLRALGIEGRLP